LSLDKAIKSGKEWRKPYRKSAAFDPMCAKHGIGGCPSCYANRMHSTKKKWMAAVEQMKDL